MSPVFLLACIERPEVFGSCVALSPSLGWDEERFLKSVESDHHWPGNVRFWFSMGTKEGRSSEANSINLSRSRRLAAQLIPTPNKSSADIFFQEFPDAAHDETAWSKQLPAALKFLPGRQNPESDGR